MGYLQKTDKFGIVVASLPYFYDFLYSQILRISRWSVNRILPEMLLCDSDITDVRYGKIQHSHSSNEWGVSLYSNT